MNIEDILKDKNIEKYLKSFKILREQTLFPPDWSMIIKNRCPFCSNKIYRMRDKPLLICRSKKHKRSFVIPEQKANEVMNSLIHKLKA